MDLVFSRPDFERLLPDLLQLWPESGEWHPDAEAQVLKLSVASRQRHEASGDELDLVCVSTTISKAQLSEVGGRIAAVRSVPWKYRRFFEKGRPSLRAALKLRPGMMLPITINRVDTTARVNTVRRLRKGGKPHFLKMDITLDTKHLPVILERETKCNCLYCGTPATSDEVNCRGCGAPLPAC